MRKRFDVEIPDGLRLGISTDDNGAFRAHLFDEDNKLVSHANLYEVEQEDSYPTLGSRRDGAADEGAFNTQSRAELSEEDLEIIAAVIVGLGVLAVAAAQRVAVELPKMQAWWKRSAIPTFRRIFDKRPRISLTRSHAVDSTVSIEKNASLREVMAACRNDMGDAVARRRLVDMLVSRLPDKGISVSKRREARGGARPDVGSQPSPTFDKMLVGTKLMYMLENNPSILEDESVEALIRLFAGPALAGQPMRLEIDV